MRRFRVDGEQGERLAYADDLETGRRLRGTGAERRFPTDEIYEKYLQKAISEINDLADEIARAAGDACDRARLGPPARRRHAAQVLAAGVGAARGRRLLRPRRPGDPQVAAAAARRPDGRLRDELPQVRRRRARRARRCVADARAAHRPAEARRRHGRACARVPEQARVPALASAGAEARRAAARSRRPSRRSSCRTWTRRSTSRRRRRRFWNAFKSLGDWWAALPPY